MDQRKLTCACGQQFSEEEFGKHYSSCLPFRQKFKEFDIKFGDLLKSHCEPKERLLIVKFLLMQYIVVIDKKLNKYYAHSNQNPRHSEQYPDGNVPPSLGVDNEPPLNNNNMVGLNQNSNVNQNNNHFNNMNNQNRQNIYQNRSSNNNHQNNNKNKNPYQNNLNQN